MLEGIPDGERNGEVWHILATIDVHEGNYPAARAGFAKALAIKQAIGDKAGEAAAWHQLALIDVHEGNYPAARESSSTR
ncbi:MAG: tetratricopeptide repeat protein [Gemmataceae bacterium]|nr:tetratricopeptide repeat protein [Gemmataceae bacterium]